MGTFYIMCGIPGSGKTTLAKNIPPGVLSSSTITYMNSDDIRSERLLELGHHVPHQNWLSDEQMSLASKQEFEKDTWKILTEGLSDLIAYRNNPDNDEEIYTDYILDATNTEQWRLEEWFEFAYANNLKPKVIVMATPLNVCIERNSEREYPVPEDVMKYMYNNFMMTMGWLYLEHPEKIINSTHLQ